MKKEIKENKVLSQTPVISRSYSSEEVRELFKKLETDRSKFYAADAADILPLDEWFSQNGL